MEFGSIKTDNDIIEESVANCPLLTKQVSIKEQFQGKQANTSHKD